MNFKRQRPEEGGINLTPLIDVVFLLLIFFMVSTVFKKDELVFYNDVNDLVDKVNFYKNNDKIRKKIAHKGRKKYFKLFSEVKTTKYIIDTSLGKNSSLI